MARPRAFDEDTVLDAVTHTFWRKGFEATSAQDLVEATGLGRGSLYAAFSSKDELFRQALRRYRGQAKAHAELVLREGSPKANIREFLRLVVDGDGKHRGCLATNSAIEMAGREPDVADLVRENFGILTRALEEAIRRGQAAGEFRREADAATLALFVFSSVQGLRVLAGASAPGDQARLHGVIDQTVAALS